MHVPTDPKKVRALIDQQQRTPFKDILATYLGCMPDEQSIQSFANTYPDRYAKAIGDLAKLSGYKDDTGNEYNIYLNIQSMSDSEIELRKAELENKLREADGLPTPPPTAPGSSVLTPSTIDDAEYKEV